MSKLEALRNAVLNSALPCSPDDDVQLMFLNLVDTFTEWHLRLLNYLSLSRFERGKEMENIERTFPELLKRREFADQIIKDLFLRGLVNKDSILGLRELDSSTTPLGRQLLEFVSSPI